MQAERLAVAYKGAARELRKAARHLEKAATAFSDVGMKTCRAAAIKSVDAALEYLRRAAD